MTDSTPLRKPAKPYPDFPLFPHATGRWCKKIKGKHHYFGPWNDSDGALQRYLEQKDDLHAGRVPREVRGGMAVADLANRFIMAKRALVKTGELAERTWGDYLRSARRLVAILGEERAVDDLVAADFGYYRADLAETLGPAALNVEIQRIRMIFKWGYDEGLIDKPMRYGQSFNRPSRKTLRQARHAAGSRLFEAHEIRAVLGAAEPQLKAMVLLGINCGFGNSDCATLPVAAIVHEKCGLGPGWIDYPRPKTGVPRTCPLWPETEEALACAIDLRPQPKAGRHDNLVFITPAGLPYGKTTSDNPISRAMGKLLRSLGVHRPGLGFYALRHTFQTIGDGARDPIATRFIMGHAESANDMSAVYREAIGDDRLRAVVDHVHDWLFGEKT